MTRQETPDRYEFRYWGDDLAGPAKRVLAHFEATDESETLETYIVPPRADPPSIKIRGGQLEIKVLRERRDRLERWHPRLESPFPLDMRKAGPELAEVLDVADWPTEDGIATVVRLFEAIAAKAPRTRIRDVRKRRSRFMAGALSAEHVFVEACGGRWQSLALESEDSEQLGSALARFDLLKRRNESYPAFLQRIA